MRPPEIPTTIEDLPSDPKERHEALVEIFAQYVFWARNSTLQSSKALVDSTDNRERLARVFREPFDKLGDLESEQREAACEFAKACLDSFARELLRLIGNQGMDLRLGARHAVRFRMEMEVYDIETKDIVLEEVISQGGEKFLPEYWGRWLNRYGTE